jgi:uncharacterized protein DUF5670
MIMTIIGILLLLWLVGLIAHIGGGFIYTLLVIALVVFIYDRLVGRRASR